MSNNIAVKVDHVSKFFRLPTEATQSLRTSLINRFKGIKGYKEQHVLKDISFEVEKGDFYGIVSVEAGGLAGAVAAQQPHHLAAGDFHGHVLDHHAAVVGLHQVLGLQAADGFVLVVQDAGVGISDTQTGLRARKIGRASCRERV